MEKPINELYSYILSIIYILARIEMKSINTDKVE